MSSKLTDDSDAPAGRPRANLRPRFARGARRDARGAMRLWRIPGARRLPGLLAEVDEDVVLFDSWGGRFSDNPRALSEALHRRGAPLHQVWVRSARADGPPWATTVLTGSREHLAWMRRARYIVANNTLPGFFRKRRSTTYLQTWHGTPLKRIAFDMPFDHSRYERAYRSHLEREVPQWDRLLSANPFSTKTFRRAFRFDGAILEAGYPRNDALCADFGGEARSAVRRSMRIDPDAFVVLYAPTFRQIGSFTLELDLRRVADALGPGTEILFRGHHLAPQGFEQRHPGVRDVSRSPEDIRELYLAADVLVTDYSSTMFDFAVSRKPMVFFTYDLEHYRDRLRGFYFDFEREAPGPLLRTTDEVIDALRQVPAVAREWRTAYRRFRDRFCPLDDGRASDRVLDAVFGSLGGQRVAAGERRAPAPCAGAP